MTTAPPFAEPTRGSHAAALLLCRCGVEIWRTTYESDAHEVSNLGRIRRATTKHILKGHVGQEGYRQQTIDGQALQSHRIVARAFIPNPSKKPTVDHVEPSEKSNNGLTNLRWATGAEQRANTERRATNEKKRRPVRMLDKETREFIRRFESVASAARHLNKDPTNIGAVLRGRQKTAYGFVWEYEPVETIEGEEWRLIPSELFDLLEPHEVSSYGRIKNLTSGRMGSGSTKKTGVVCVSLTFADGGRERHIPVARVVASVFLENPESKPIVCHVDGNSVNNHVSNLAWATRAEVIQASHDRGMSNSWTEEEDAALRDFVESNRDNRGRIKWKDIMLPEILQNRTVQALKHRLHLLNQSET